MLNLSILRGEVRTNAGWGGGPMITRGGRFFMPVRWGRGACTTARSECRANVMGGQTLVREDVAKYHKGVLWRDATSGRSSRSRNRSRGRSRRRSRSTSTSTIMSTIKRRRTSRTRRRVRRRHKSRLRRRRRSRSIGLAPNSYGSLSF